MTNYRSVGVRMGSQRRMFSRRSVIGLFCGVILGFNLASWIAIPAPSHTDIEIELIASDARLQGQDGPEIRVGAARVRHNNKIGYIKTGRDCDDKVDYASDSFGKKGRRAAPSMLESRNKQPFENPAMPADVDAEREEKREIDADVSDEFDLEEERLKRQKELEIFYESDIEAENYGDAPQEVDGLEGFQFLDKAQKYIDYDGDLTVQNDQQSLLSRMKGQVQTPLKKLASKSLHQPKPTRRTVTDRKHFIYIGVLTAEKYLATRGRAIMDTWASNVPGKVEFYVGEGVKNVDEGEPPIPIVRLPTVKDDVYPPQKKSFLLLKRMHDAYLNSGYQWFMRADDDVYIKPDLLEKFLRKLNSSKPIFLGQTGLGNAEERGRLSLPHGDNYCMGGPGMIFSREVLRRVGPRIRDCVRHLYSWHEDVELSRCVRRYADVNCAWSYEMQELFYEHYSLRKGYIDPYVEPHNRKLHSAFTLHPNKNPHYHIKLHKFMKSLTIEKRLKKIRELSRDVVDADRWLHTTSNMEDYMLGIPPTLHRFIPRSRDEVRTWDFMTERLWYSASPNQARRSIPADRLMTNRRIIMKVMQAMNENSKVRGRVIEFNQIAYGYRRVNPLYGAEYVLDLLLFYKRFKGKKVALPVRRHAYLQQTFARTELRELCPLDVEILDKVLQTSNTGLLSVISSVLKRGQNMLSMIGLAPEPKVNSPVLQIDYGDVKTMSKQNGNDYQNKIVRYDSGKYMSYVNDVTQSDIPTVHIVIPLMGRFETFKSFMANFEKVCLLRADPVSLSIVLFTSEDPQVQEEFEDTSRLLGNYAERYPQYDLRIIPINSKFSRGLGLEIGTSHFSNNSLLFFCDIDVVFDETFMRKCRANTVRGSRVYYPVLFSEFHPDFKAVWTALKEFPNKGVNQDSLRNATIVRRLQTAAKHFDIKSTLGYWRNYGYGLLCTYKSDFAASGGFDTSIQGWGMEDVDLVDKFTGAANGGVKGRRPIKHLDHQNKDSSSRRGVAVMRTYDPSLVHVYHPSYCDPNLMENQMRMCRASRASSIASVGNLASAWEEVLMKEGLPTRIVQDPVSDIIPVENDHR